MTETAAWLSKARRGLFETYRRDATTEWIQATGSSMRPLIRPGTWMLVEFGARPERIGEIVVFPLGETHVAHRVVARRRAAGSASLVTKGDAQPYRERPLAPSDVLGVVRAIRRDPAGKAVSLGCTGRSALTVAVISNTSGRAAALARRAARRLPDPASRPALRAATALTRVVSRAGALPFAVLAQLDSTVGRR